MCEKKPWPRRFPARAPRWTPRDPRSRSAASCRVDELAAVPAALEPGDHVDVQVRGIVRHQVLVGGPRMVDLVGDLLVPRPVPRGPRRRARGSAAAAPATSPAPGAARRPGCPARPGSSRPPRPGLPPRTPAPARTPRTGPRTRARAGPGRGTARSRRVRAVPRPGPARARVRGPIRGARAGAGVRGGKPPAWAATAWARWTAGPSSGAWSGTGGRRLRPLRALDADGQVADKIHHPWVTDEDLIAGYPSHRS